MILHSLRDARAALGLAVVFMCGTLSACTKVLEQPEALPPLAPGALQEAPPPPPIQRLPARKSWGVANRGAGSSSDRMAESLNGEQDGLNRTQLNAAIQAVLPGLARCFLGTTESAAMVTFEADPNGSPRGVAVTGVNPQAQACIADLIGAVSYPRFKGNPVPISYPLSIHRMETPPPAPAATAAAAVAPGEPVPPAGSAAKAVPGVVQAPPTNFINP